MQITCSSDWRLHLKTVPWDWGCFPQWWPVGTCFVHFVGHQLGFRMARLSLGLQHSSSSLGSFPTGSFRHYSSWLPLARSGPERRGWDSTEGCSFSSYFPAPGSFPGAWMAAISRLQSHWHQQSRALHILINWSSACGPSATASSVLPLCTGQGYGQSSGTPRPLVVSQPRAARDISSPCPWFSEKGAHTQPTSSLLRSHCLVPAAAQISQLCSPDFTAFVLLVLVLFCLVRKPAHIPTDFVLFKGLPILYVSGVNLINQFLLLLHQGYALFSCTACHF